MHDIRRPVPLQHQQQDGADHDHEVRQSKCTFTGALTQNIRAIPYSNNKDSLSGSAEFKRW